MPQALRNLTVLQHALFTVLTIVCAVRALATGAAALPALGITAALLAWYVAGAATAHLQPGDAADRGRPTRVVVLWLCGLTALWLALVAISHEYVWIAFSLWLLAGHLLVGWWGAGYVALTLAVVVLVPWWATGGASTPGVLGPTIGAVFALFVSRGQMQLVREATQRQRLVRSLVAAQEETEILHSELARTQRESGALAERARLSRDIHDTLAQGFSSILLLARAGRAARDEAQVGDLLGQIEESAAANLDEARRVVGALAPRDLEGAGLPAALRRVLDTLAAETGLRTELRVEGEVAGLPTSIEVALMRTAQGALANVRLHANASRVVVSLSDLGDSVRLDVVDDGTGFDPGPLTWPPSSVPAGGYGIPSIRARLREIGGGLDIESAPGEGTALSAHVPLREGAP
ncbi:sensor histidine kinase [Intrasporangium sp.]|uniref:sensor histidine kinase n=1 Tax=Intrasporangium sp. TaxID=1925024 RepID=UPI00293AF5A2|nr:sensor histidine kinase [Intrasporangium sp.]MDV3223321.1 sensor histidine kinase [Intrasporangium sp.]